MRDLTQEHLPILKSIRDESFKVIENFFGIKQEKIRAFFHYHPTFYHLHVHFAHVHRVESAGAFIDRELLLDDVINNIELKGDYY